MEESKIDEGFDNLVIAIVERAVKDYRKALADSIKRKNPEKRQLAMNEAKELEKWFVSDWANALTNFTGSYIIKCLKKEAYEKFINCN